MAQNETERMDETWEEEDGATILTLTDDETGEEVRFELLDEWQDGDRLYYALICADDEEAENYEIFRVTEDGEGITLDAIEDDDEWERVAEYFDDRFMSETDYDTDENAEN